MPSEPIHADLISRLRSVEGHVRGIIRMVESGGIVRTSSCKCLPFRVPSARSTVFWYSIISTTVFEATCGMRTRRFAIRYAAVSSNCMPSLAPRQGCPRERNRCDCYQWLIASCRWSVGCSAAPQLSLRPTSGSGATMLVSGRMLWPLARIAKGEPHGTRD